MNVAKRTALLWIIDTIKHTYDQRYTSSYVKPGSDGALAPSMMHIMHQDDLEDTTFIQHMCKRLLSFFEMYCLHLLQNMFPHM